MGQSRNAAENLGAVLQILQVRQCRIIKALFDAQHKKNQDREHDTCAHRDTKPLQVAVHQGGEGSPVDAALPESSAVLAQRILCRSELGDRKSVV